MKTLILCVLVTLLVVFAGVVGAIAIFGPSQQPCDFGPCTNGFLVEK